MGTIDRASRFDVFFANCEIDGIGFASLRVVRDQDTGIIKSANVQFFDFDGDLFGSRQVSGLIGKPVNLNGDHFRLTAQHRSLLVIGVVQGSLKPSITSLSLFIISRSPPRSQHLALRSAGDQCRPRQPGFR